jgi:hypothetical protein
MARRIFVNAAWEGRSAAKPVAAVDDCGLVGLSSPRDVRQSLYVLSP